MIKFEEVVEVPPAETSGIASKVTSALASVFIPEDYLL